MLRARQYPILLDGIQRSGGDTAGRRARVCFLRRRADGVWVQAGCPLSFGELSGGGDWHQEGLLLSDEETAAIISRRENCP